MNGYEINKIQPISAASFTEIKSIRCTSKRRQLDSLLDTCNDDEITIATATIKGIIQVRKTEEA